MDGNGLTAYINGKKEHEAYEVERLDTLNYISNQYAMYAFHSPSKYPKRPLLQRREAQKIAIDKSPEKQALALKMWAISMGAKEVKYDN